MPENDEAAIKEATDNFEASKAKLISSMNALEAKSKLYLLQPEEVQLLQAFKQFKASLKKPKVFTWMTQPFKVPE